MLARGYLHPDYAMSLAEFGEPIELPSSGGWLLKRPIPGTTAFDAMGCYPYLTCQNWAALSEDLKTLDKDIVSVAAAVDPCGQYDPTLLKELFPDRCIHFKDHFLADLRLSSDKIVSKRHRSRARKALRQVSVAVYEQPIELIDQWMSLFDFATKKFNLKGIRAFSKNAFAKQFALPGCTMSVARHHGEIVSAHIQFSHGDTVYAHLAAKSPIANELGADFALYYAEIEHFRDKARWIDWGGGAGLSGVQTSLDLFKRGWSTETRSAFFGGRILDPQRYYEIARLKGIQSEGYFPTYRTGEFA